MKAQSEHCLKTDSIFYFDVVTRRKKFEVRKNDRDYQMGDTLILCELRGKALSGWCLKCNVHYVLEASDFPDGIKEGYVVMGIEAISNSWFEASLMGKSKPT